MLTNKELVKILCQNRKKKNYGEKKSEEDENKENKSKEDERKENKSKDESEDESLKKIMRNFTKLIKNKRKNLMMDTMDVWLADTLSYFYFLFSISKRKTENKRKKPTKI